MPVLATYAGQVLRIMDALKRVRRQGETSGLEMQRETSIAKRLYVSTVILFPERDLLQIHSDTCQ